MLPYNLTTIQRSGAGEINDLLVAEGGNVEKKV